MRLITITTDFGTADWFVGTMKGVVAGIAPAVRVIDITHEIPPGGIREGAFALAAAVPFFPDETVHVAVVDPGVGSARAALAIRSGGAVFIGPDNGVLSWALRGREIEAIRHISNADWFLQPVSRTFHGRDVFAPVAARLAAGAAIEEAGETAPDFVRLPWPEVQRDAGSLCGEVLYVDRFGNAITNLRAEELPATGMVELSAAAVTARRVTCYAEGRRDEAIALAGSSGYLELALPGGSFAAAHGVAAGTAVEARWEAPE